MSKSVSLNIAKHSKRRKRKPTVYNKFQKQFKKFLVSGKIKLGKEYYNYSKPIYQDYKGFLEKAENKDRKLKVGEIRNYLRKRYFYYKDNPPVLPDLKEGMVEADENFAFYYAEPIFAEPRLNNQDIRIKVIFGDFSFDCNINEFPSYFKRELKPHLRLYHNESPVAQFVLYKVEIINGKRTLIYFVDVEPQKDADYRPEYVKGKKEGVLNVGDIEKEGERGKSKKETPKSEAVELEKIKLEAIKEQEKTKQMEASNEAKKLALEEFKLGLISKKEYRKKMGY